MRQLLIRTEIICTAEQGGLMNQWRQSPSSHSLQRWSKCLDSLPQELENLKASPWELHALSSSCFGIERKTGFTSAKSDAPERASGLGTDLFRRSHCKRSVRIWRREWYTPYYFKLLQILPHEALALREFQGNSSQKSVSHSA
jgi:hypothetical protein